MSTCQVIGPLHSTGLCASCLAEWHAWRDLIYNPARKGTLDA